MNTKNRKKFPDSIKRKAVDEFVNGIKSAEEIAKELQIHSQAIYRWRTMYDERAKGVEIDELEVRGLSKEHAKLFIQKQEEIEEYQKKVAEQSLIIDLLKKLRKQGPLPPENELNGLIETVKKLAQKQKRVK